MYASTDVLLLSFLMYFKCLKGFLMLKQINVMKASQCLISNIKKQDSLM